MKEMHLLFLLFFFICFFFVAICDKWSADILHLQSDLGRHDCIMFGVLADSYNSAPFKNVQFEPHRNQHLQEMSEWLR